jgi:hypothetical protein
MTCKNHILKRTANPIKETIIRQPLELIQIYNVRYSDSNDVFENVDIRGTYTQLHQYAKEYFKQRYWKYIDDDSNQNEIIISIYENEWNTLLVECIPQGIEHSEYKEYRDLVANDFRDKPRYINNQTTPMSTE